jgi:hypothetical protein
MPDVIFPPDLNPVSPENVELVDDATQVFAPSFARGMTQRVSFGDPRWKITRKYSAARAEDKARLMTVMLGARGRLNTVRTVPGYVQRGSFPSQELLVNTNFSAGSVNGQGQFIPTGWNSESTFGVVAKDRILRSLRLMSGSTAFFCIADIINTVTAFAPYVARFFVRLGSGYDSTTFQFRIDDYSVLAGTQQAFKSMATQVLVPRTTSVRPGIAQLAPVTMIADGHDYIDVSWASLTRCALADTGVNLIPFSDTFSDASWVKVNASIGVNVTTGPDGTTTADSLIEDATAAVQHFIQTPNITVSSSTGFEYTATAYVKANTRTWCHLALVEFTGPSQAGASFNLSAGTIGTVVNGTNMVNCRAAITSLGNGWYKISVTARKSNAATVMQPHLYLATGDNTFNYDGNGVNSIYIWRCGFSQSSQPSVPNQTTGSADTTGSSFRAGYLPVKGLPASAFGTLLAGDYVEINGELKRLNAAVHADANGNAVLHFRPQLVNAPADNDPVIIGFPMGRFLISGMKWDAQWGLQEDVSLLLDEVYE